MSNTSDLEIILLVINHEQQTLIIYKNTNIKLSFIGRINTIKGLEKRFVWMPLRSILQEKYQTKIKPFQFTKAVSNQKLINCCDKIECSFAKCEAQIQ